MIVLLQGKVFSDIFIINLREIKLLKPFIFYVIK